MALSADSPLDTRTVAGVDVVRFPEESLTDERRLVETLDGLGRRLTDPAGARILLDLANVERLSSAGLSKLISLLKKAKANGGSFKLCSLRRPVRDLFEVLRLGMIFEIHDTEEDALEAFGKEMTEEKPS